MGTRRSNKGAEYTGRGISDILNRRFSVSPRWIVNNLHAYNREPDYPAITRPMYAYGVGVKIPSAGYNKDFEKEGKRQVTQALYETGDRARYGRPNYPCYRVPDGLVDPKGIPPYAGLAYVRGGNLGKAKDAPVPRRGKFDPEAYRMAGKSYYNRWNERRKAGQIEGKDMEDGFRKSMEKVEGKITADAKAKAMGAFWSVRDYAHWPYGGRGARNGTRPSRSWRGM